MKNLFFWFLVRLRFRLSGMTRVSILLMALVLVCGCDTNDDNFVFTDSPTLLTGDLGSGSVPDLDPPVGNPDPTDFGGRPSERGIVLVNTTAQGEVVGRRDFITGIRTKLSADGSKLFFVSSSISLISEVVQSPLNVFGNVGYMHVLDLATNQAEAIAIDIIDTDFLGDYVFDDLNVFDISNDGRYILFRSFDRLDDAHPGSSSVIYRYDLQTKEVEVVLIPDVDPDNTDRRIIFDDPEFLGSPDLVLFGTLFKNSISIRDMLLNTTTALTAGELPIGDRASRDGRYLIYNDNRDMFRLDRQTNTSLKLDLRADNTDSPLGDSLFASISDDGQFVAFFSNDRDLVSPPSPFRGLYVRDIALGVTEFLTDTGGGTPSLQDLDVSSGGRFVAFVSNNDDLAATFGLNPEINHIYLRDRDNNETIAVTALVNNPNELVPDLGSTQNSVRFSSDGKYLTFIWRAPNQAAHTVVYLYNTDTGELRDIFGELGLFQASEVNVFAASRDGNVISFSSNEYLEGPIVEEIPGLSRFYQTDLTKIGENGLKELSTTPDGHVYNPAAKELNRLEQQVDMNDTGTATIFMSTLDLDPNDGPEESLDIFTSIDREDAFFINEGANGPVNVSTQLSDTGRVSGCSISGDGSTAFYSYTSDGEARTLVQLNLPDLTPNIFLQGVGASGTRYVGLELNRSGKWLGFIDQSVTFNNESGAVFLVNTDTQELTEVTSGIPGIHGQDGQLSLTDDGRFLVFSSDAAVVPEDTNSVSDVFVYDRESKQIVRVSTDSQGQQLMLSSRFGSISADGRYLSFVSFDPNLAVADNNEGADIFIKDLLTGEVRLASTTASGATPLRGSDQAIITKDGTRVIFRSSAPDIVVASGETSVDLFSAPNPFLFETQ